MKKRTSRISNPTPRRVFLLCILVAVSFLLLLSIIRISKKYHFVKDGRNELREEIAETQKSIEGLENSLDYLDTPNGTERALRQQFRVASEGEELIVIVPDKN